MKLDSSAKCPAMLSSFLNRKSCHLEGTDSSHSSNFFWLGMLASGDNVPWAGESLRPVMEFDISVSLYVFFFGGGGGGGLIMMVKAKKKRHKSSRAAGDCSRNPTHSKV